MNIEVTTEPTTEPVSVDEAKDHILLSSSFVEDDAYLDGLIKAARRRVERYLGRSLLTQTITLELDSDEVTDPLWLPRPPHQSVTSIKTFDDDDVETTVSSSNYRVVGNNPSRVVQINEGWDIDRHEKAMEVIYVAGYSDVPEEIKTAIKMVLAQLYEHRGEGKVPFQNGLMREMVQDYRYDYL